VKDGRARDIQYSSTRGVGQLVRAEGSDKASLGYDAGWFRVIDGGRR
jgi:hypothetical protein